ncbi:energy-coupling factor ABC transporter ATP-binding protein [Methanocella arvoryzae]|uniref:ABC-type cobalt import system, ATPase component n=1 Tax=Methanocella arvoryzae (strain DSM 22066 / NBRC 105507 / MRE50) TaxID=351160 RepID=Q0W3S3_METAR|nr:ABC transporter ATP-binding protein [Methanocella arvoryzae]CAJ36970.1 putative ABC-type cobalt import system, ATPase component [Methanocella arvoryzae MRE50]
MPVKAEGVSHFYYDVTALDAVELEIGPGELVAVCGRNGSGKSTLLKCLAGLQKPSMGTVTIDGQPAAKARSKVGLAIQFPERALFGKTIYDDLAFAPKNAGLKDEDVSRRVAYAKEAIGMPDSLLTQPHASLSYGQKRLAGIASVLSARPAYLFLDEPTAGLDYPWKRRIAELLRSLNRSGVTIVIASHDPSFFADICSRLIILDGGQVVSDGAPVKVDLARAGIRSDTLALARKLKECGFDVPETFSPEDLADRVAEVIRRESAGHN